MSLDEFIDNNDAELIEQLAQIGIRPHNYTEEQQQQKHRRWEEELHQGVRRKKKE